MHPYTQKLIECFPNIEKAKIIPEGIKGAPPNMDRLQMIHPEFHKEGADDDVRGIVPIYPQIQGISQNEIRKLQITASPLAAEIEEWLPEKLVRENRLASPAFAIENIHFPKDGKAVLAGKFRLIFDELITLETGLFYMRNDQRKDTGGITIDTSMDREFLGILPFKLTEGQQSAWQDMLARNMQSQCLLMTM